MLGQKMEVVSSVLIACASLVKVKQWNNDLAVFEVEFDAFLHLHHLSNHTAIVCSSLYIFFNFLFLFKYLQTSFSTLIPQ